MANEGERLVIAETQIKAIMENQRDLYRKLESVQRSVWIGVGMMLVLEFLFKK